MIISTLMLLSISQIEESNPNDVVTREIVAQLLLECGELPTQVDANHCAPSVSGKAYDQMRLDFERAREQASKFDQQLITESRMSGAAQTAANLSTAQALWQEYVEAQCTTVGDRYLGGSIRVFMIFACHAEHYAKRAADLREEIQKNGD